MTRIEDEPLPPRPEDYEDEDLQHETLVRYLAYQDAPLSPEALDSLREQSVSSESAQRYEGSLEQMFINDSEELVLRRADAIQEKVLRQLDAMGLTPAPHTLSRSWVLWDLAKQNYIFRETQAGRDLPFKTEEYEARPWNSREKIAEVEFRHLGWEFYRNYNLLHSEGMNDVLYALEGDEDRFEKIQSLLRKKPKENGTLSSKELEKLGHLIIESWNHLPPKERPSQDRLPQSERDALDAVHARLAEHAVAAEEALRERQPARPTPASEEAEDHDDDHHAHHPLQQPYKVERGRTYGLDSSRKWYNKVYIPTPLGRIKGGHLIAVFKMVFGSFWKDASDGISVSAGGDHGHGASKGKGHGHGKADNHGHGGGHKH